MLLTKFNKTVNSILEEIETYNDKPNPPGGNNITHTDIGSITGNQTKFQQPYHNNPDHTTDIGSVTGNQANFQPPYKSNISSEQAVPEAAVAPVETTVTEPITAGITTSDIKEIYTPALPYKKIKSQKYNRKYPLFSRFK